MTSESAYDRAKKAADYIRARISALPEIVVVLGSGQGSFAEEVTEAVTIPYGDIPGFSHGVLPGHAGQLIVGKIGGKNVLVLSGRMHCYQGYDLLQVTHPLRTAYLLGCRRAFLLNAAGGINPDYQVGDLMLITDHINYAGKNPLIGENDERFGPRFPDMTDAYTPALVSLADRAAAKAGFSLKRGTYLWTLGPSFETPAEIRFFRTIGADAVGMSTVPEVIVCRHMGMEILGLSLITNAAAGLSGKALSHIEVLEAGKTAALRIVNLLKELIIEG